MAKRLSGRVKWFDSKKGYGFIFCDQDKKDYFVHFKDISGNGFRVLTEKQLVEFEVVACPRGEKAANVMVFA